jgi:hypothetical protein
VNTRRLGALIFTILGPAMATAGDIPGLPTMTPPLVDRQLELSFSNDFLGRGGSVDDFRTQQITLSAAIAERWVAVFDHSVLTLSDPAQPGRIDQLSASLGYRLVESSRDRSLNRLVGGIGFRSAGDFAGERMQNGFHRLIDSDIENLPYSALDDTYLTAWLDAERYAVIRDDAGGWRLAWNLRGRALVTSDGQFDATASALLVAGKRFFDAWGGLRHDWRTGYEEPVQRATADAEADTAVVLGMRFGSMVIETVQQLNNDASFGQLRFLASQHDSPAINSRPARLGLELGFLLPDVHVRLAGRLRSAILVPSHSAWRESVVLSVDVGEPQHSAGPTVFIDSTQLGIAFEWERSLASSSDWLSGYVSFGAGWREEQLIGDGALAGERSETSSSAVVLGSAGLRFHASELGSRWRYRIQTGITAWAPTDKSVVTLDGLDLPVLEPGVSFVVGFSFDFS